jgi:DNA modification methylase
MKELNKILIGNCIDIMSELLPESIDMVFAQPPKTLVDFYYEEEDFIYNNPLKAMYNDIQYNYNNIDYLDFTQQWVEKALRVLKKDGSIYITTTYENLAEIIITLKKFNMHFINLITWNKTNMHNKSSEKNFINKCEYLVLFAKDTSYTFNKDLLKKGKSKKTSDLETLSNLWNIQMNNHDNGYYQDEKPEELIRRAVIASTNYGSVILEPFCKTGLTCSVAIKNDRNYIGITPNKMIARKAKSKINRIRRKITKTYKKGQVDLFIKPVSRN